MFLTKKKKNAGHFLPFSKKYFQRLSLMALNSILREKGSFWVRFVFFEFFFIPKYKKYDIKNKIDFFVKKNYSSVIFYHVHIFLCSINNISYKNTVLFQKLLTKSTFESQGCHIVKICENKF